MTSEKSSNQLLALEQEEYPTMQTTVKIRQDIQEEPSEVNGFSMKKPKIMRESRGLVDPRNLSS